MGATDKPAFGLTRDFMDMDGPHGANMTPAHVEYRQVTKRDLPEIATIFLWAFHESVRHYAGKPVGERVIIDAFDICLDAEPGAFIAAVVNGRVAGYIFAPSRLSSIYHAAIWRGHIARMIWRWATGQYGVGLKPALIAARNQLAVWWHSKRDKEAASEARIFSIAVHPDFQGRHIGTGLLKAGLDYLGSRGAKRVRLEVRPENIPAINIYEKAGFKIAGRTRDTQADWLIMVKEFF